MARLTKPEDIESAAKAAECVVETHRRVAAFLRHGMTLPQVDEFVAKTLADLGCTSCFFGYAPDRSHVPFPSNACLSVNQCVVHGTRGYYTDKLKAGDVLKVDIGVFHKGWVGDAAWTYSIGEPTPVIRKLMDCGKESLRRGVQALTPANQWIEWARAVQGHVEHECGFHLIRGLGGHGIGFKQLHGPPFVSNTVPVHANEWREAFEKCPVGTLVAVEPMIAVGTGRTYTNMVDKKRHDWPVFTADGSMSVHYEHDVLITAEGPRVLTAGLEQLDDVIRS
jgi:methionyl aminopeptidase